VKGGKKTRKPREGGKEFPLTLWSKAGVGGDSKRTTVEHSLQESKKNFKNLTGKKRGVDRGLNDSLGQDDTSLNGCAREEIATVEGTAGEKMRAFVQNQRKSVEQRQFLRERREQGEPQQKRLVHRKEGPPEKMAESGSLKKISKQTIERSKGCEIRGGDEEP